MPEILKGSSARGLVLSAWLSPCLALSLSRCVFTRDSLCGCGSSDGNPVTQPSVPVGVVQSLPDKSEQPPAMPVIEVIEETGQATGVEPAVVAAEQPAAELLDVQVEQPPTESAEVVAAPSSAI